MKYCYAHKIDKFSFDLDQCQDYAHVDFKFIRIWADTEAFYYCLSNVKYYMLFEVVYL